MRIEWLSEAVRNRQGQIAYIAERSPRAAIRIGDALDIAVTRLAEYPKIGRPGRVAGTRELVVTGTPYVIIYRIEPITAVILRVLHGAQRWPPKPQSE